MLDTSLTLVSNYFLLVSASHQQASCISHPERTNTRVLSAVSGHVRFGHMLQSECELSSVTGCGWIPLTFSCPLCPCMCSSLGTRSWPTVPRCTTTSTKSSRYSPWRSESPSEPRHTHLSWARVSPVSCPSLPFLPLRICVIFWIFYDSVCVCVCVCVCVWPLQTQGWAKSSWLRSIDRWGERGRRFHSVWVSWIGTCEWTLISLCYTVSIIRSASTIHNAESMLSIGSP